MFCHRCGQQLPSDALFCNHCGTKIQSSEQGISNASSLGRVTIQFDNTTQYARPTRDLYEFGASQPNTYQPNNSTEQFSNSPNASTNQFQWDLPFPSSHITYSTPTPQSQSNISGTQYPPVWQVGTEPPTQQVRTSMPEPPLMASNRVQEVLVRIFGANLSTSPLFGIALGGVLAAVSGLLAAALLVSIFHALAPQIANSANGTSGEDIVDYALGIYPLHNLYRDSLQFFLIMHGVGTHTQDASSAGSYFYTSDSYFPLY
jgi:zinc-ribbon domain